VQQSSSRARQGHRHAGGCACGDGVIDWAKVIKTCKKLKQDIVFSVECGTVDQAERSIAHFKSLIKS